MAAEVSVSRNRYDRLPTRARRSSSARRTVAVDGAADCGAELNENKPGKTDEKGGVADKLGAMPLIELFKTVSS